MRPTQGCAALQRGDALPPRHALTPSVINREPLEKLERNSEILQRVVLKAKRQTLLRTLKKVLLSTGSRDNVRENPPTDKHAHEPQGAEEDLLEVISSAGERRATSDERRATSDEPRPEDH
ncbi:hypothetical protein EYF80_052844 [Liparis tanakae]|uniref:Uncharacterized protein n=1 Tax=Liparis tanakae TaxID=230148 RepID=A0A4Z2F858_9TELE|nr:hypothetical protein EYF80_052844 [Liparis tanakae]